MDSGLCALSLPCLWLSHHSFPKEGDHGNPLSVSPAITVICPHVAPVVYLQMEAALTGNGHKDFMGGEGLLLWRKKPRVSGQFYSDGNLVGARQAPLSFLSWLKRSLESRVSVSRPYHVTVYNSSRSFLQI